MSATATDASPTDAGTTTTTETADLDLTDKQREILGYLREHVDTKTYFKSRLIAEELALSSKEVGTNMPAIRDNPTGLTVEKWGYSSATTWKVTC